MIPTGPLLKNVKLDPVFMDRLTGKYKIKDIGAVIPVFREGNTLYTKTGFWEKVALLPENENCFHGFSKKFGDIQVDVIYDKKGNVAQLTASFELRSMQLDKIK